MLEKVICHRIPIQALQFLTALPTRQDGAGNRYKVYFYMTLSRKDWELPN